MVAEGRDSGGAIRPVQAEHRQGLGLLAGGKENFAADRELAQTMLAVHPVSAQMARENRKFLGRGSAM